MKFRNLEYLADRASRAAAEAERHGFLETAKALRSIFAELPSLPHTPNYDPGTPAIQSIH